MALDPITLIMFALIAVVIFFMFRNGKKRQAAMQELQNGLRPGAEVMLQSGIFGTVESVDDEDNRLTVRSGNSTLVVHRNAISQIVTQSEEPLDNEASTELAPDDDPEFGERLSKSDAIDDSATEPDRAQDEDTQGGESSDENKPKE